MPIGTSDGKVYENEMHYNLDIPMLPEMAQQDLKSSPNYDPKTDVYQAPQQEALTEPKQVHIVRHGETTANDNNTVRGIKISIPLNDTGRQEAEKAGEELKEKGVDTIVSSDLPRAKETAEIIGKKLGVTPQYDPRLRTWDVGKFEGTDCDKSNLILAHYAEHIQDRAPPGGESFNDFTNRSFAGIRDAVLNNKDKELAIITHNRVEATLKGWEKTGQDNPGIDYKEVVKESTPGNVRSITLQPTATILQPTEFDERHSGMPTGMPVQAPGESFEGTPSLWHSNLREPKPFPGQYPHGYEDFKNAPYIEQKDLDLYNPVTDITRGQKLQSIESMGGGGPRMTVPAYLEKSKQYKQVFDLVKKGKDFSEISKSTGLSKEEVKDILGRDLNMPSSKELKKLPNYDTDNPNTVWKPKGPGHGSETPDWFKDEMEQTLEKELIKKNIK